MYHGQTKRPLITRIKEHEAAWRLDHPELSATAEHNMETGHPINYNGTNIITSVKKHQHLDLTEFLVIKKEKPSMNRNHPELNPIYETLCPLIHCEDRTPANIDIPYLRRGKRRTNRGS